MGSIVDIIRRRKSVRSFNGVPLRKEHIDALQQYISQLVCPFDAKVRINLLNVDMGEEPVHLGTYGVISGTKSFLTLVVGDSLFSRIAGGYMFEEVILYCTSLGLGACWLGGTLSRSDFAKQLDMGDDEHLIVVAPVGYQRNKRRTVDSFLRFTAGSDHRKPFGEIFYDGSFGNPLSEERAEKYLLPLQMVRLAPSASNKQPWRVVKTDNALHFFSHEGPFSVNDIGIALCHFELTCKEEKIEGHFAVLNNVESVNRNKYIISWIQ